MKIWIDADAAPRDAKDIVFRASRRLRIEVTLVSNMALALPKGNPLVNTVRVEAGPDVADQFIATNAVPGDLAITADIPLAAILVEKGVTVIDPRGREYDDNNVGERLSVRDFMDDLRNVGVVTPGPRPYGARDSKTFAASLDRILSKIRGK